MLRTARQYDPESDTVIMADGKAYTRNTLCFAGLESLVPAMFNFCGALASMKVDNAEFGMLTCISLFSGRSWLLFDTETITFYFDRCILCQVKSALTCLFENISLKCC